MVTWRLRVDLHTHTSYSDGLDAPATLVAKAAQQGVHSLAITDHDILAAPPEAQQAGRDCGVEVLVGVELTMQYQQYDDIHLLGYFFDPTHAALQARLALAQQHRVQRGVEMLERINALLQQDGKAPLDQERVLQSARGALTRPHLAHALMARGYASSVQNAFENFLIPCNIPKASMGPEEAFALIAQAGGVCSLAHPGTLSTDPEVVHPLLDAFKAMGSSGSKSITIAITRMPLPFFRVAPRATGWWPRAARTTMGVRRVPESGRSRQGTLCLSMSCLTWRMPMLPVYRGAKA